MRTISILLLLCSTVFGQKISVKSEIAIANLKNVRVVDGFLKVDAIPDKLEGVVLTTISVDTKIPSILVTVTDINREPVTFKQVGETKDYVTTATGDLWIEAEGIDFDLKEVLRERIKVSIKPLNPKPPTPPGPKPDDPPTPQPVKSFRAIFVKESGATLNAEQTPISSAKAIREYLSSRTTAEGNLPGYREYDPQQNITNEQPAMKSLWAAAKSSITTVPCIVVEVNGKVSILPYPKNTAEALKTLKAYGGE